MKNKIFDILNNFIKDNLKIFKINKNNDINIRTDSIEISFISYFEKDFIHKMISITVYKDKIDYWLQDFPKSFNSNNNNHKEILEYNNMIKKECKDIDFILSDEFKEIFKIIQNLLK